MIVDIRDVERMHRTLLCIKDDKTEFGLFCGGIHALLLSLLGRYCNLQKVYELDVKRDLNFFCSLTDNFYDWFEELRRTQAIDAEKLEANHRIGEQVLGIVRKTREKEGRKVEGEDGEE